MIIPSLLLPALSHSTANQVAFLNGGWKVELSLAARRNADLEGPGYTIPTGAATYLTRFLQGHDIQGTQRKQRAGMQQGSVLDDYANFKANIEQDLGKVERLVSTGLTASSTTAAALGA